jgi:hypothetical protein
MVHILNERVVEDVHNHLKLHWKGRVLTEWELDAFCFVEINGLKLLDLNQA